MIHIAWDYGVIAGAFRDLGLPEPRQRTTKTLCKRRVSIEHTRGEPNCPACIEQRENEQRDAYEFAAQLDKGQV